MSKMLYNRKIQGQKSSQTKTEEKLWKIQSLHIKKKKKKKRSLRDFK